MAPEGFSPDIQELDPALREFIRDVVSTYVRWDLVTFFMSGGCAETVSLKELCETLGRDERVIRTETQELADRGLLQLATAADGTPGYRLTSRPETLTLARQFLDFVRDKTGRLKAIYFLTQLRLRSQPPFSPP